MPCSRCATRSAYNKCGASRCVCVWFPEHQSEPRPRRGKLGGLSRLVLTRSEGTSQAWKTSTTMSPHDVKPVDYGKPLPTDHELDALVSAGSGHRHGLNKIVGDAQPVSQLRVLEGLDAEHYPGRSVAVKSQAQWRWLELRQVLPAPAARPPEWFQDGLDS